MANMSYCRFENTLHDLANCVDALEGVVYYHEEISKNEWQRAKRMKRWCERFIETIEDCDEGDININ